MPEAALTWPNADRATLVEVVIILALLVLALALLALNRQRAVVRLGRREREFLELYRNIGEGVFRSTLDGRMISANPSLVRLNGFDTEEEMLREVNDIAGKWYVDPNRRAEIHELLLRQGSVHGMVSEVWRYRTRERIWIEESTRLVRHERTGDPLFYEGTVREVTETMRRLELQARYDKIASVISGCLYQYRLTPDGRSTIPYASAGIVQIFGLRPEDVRDDASVIATRFHPDDAERIQASVDTSRETLAPWQCEYRVILPGGTVKWIFGHAVPEREADGAIVWHGFLTDISEKKEHEAEIYRLAYFDTLTALPNRARLFESFPDAAEAATGWGALLFVDLDQFKLLNDTKGHEAGDGLLKAVAGRLRQSAASGDLVARVGGDEFVVVCHGVAPDRESAEQKSLDRGAGIMGLVDAPFEVGGLIFRTSASVGVAVFHPDSASVEEVLRQGDLAMHAAKSEGGRHVRLFDPAMQAAVEEKLALLGDLKRALDAGELGIVFQPQVEADGRIFGAEALLRWTHPGRGEVPPTVFVTLAETHGLGAQVDAYVLDAACARLAAWQRDPVLSRLELAVNVGAGQLGSDSFVERVIASVEGAGARPSSLVMEVTEHVLLGDAGRVAEAMARLKSFGIRFALDDFGTGYSSLAYLKRLPIDALKIDRTFIEDLEHDQNDQAIVRSIVGIAAALGVEVVAEGVETGSQALMLGELGCHAYQGFYFARPMPAEEFERLCGNPAAVRSAPVGILTAPGAMPLAWPPAGSSGAEGAAAAMVPRLKPQGDRDA